ncbi:FAD-dependent oxidoreductase [candidate division FCPU426 bacterium]|nr:FAD-dependent oxidoreductase [candidate division FCPU426 bacterium]
MRIVIIGGVAAGPKAASKIIRLNPEAEVTIVEKDKYLSYAGCGLPYYVSGEVKEQKELMCTPVGVVRDPVFFQKVKNVRVLTETEALEIDRKGKRVLVRKMQEGVGEWLSYDKLVLATGSDPVVPPLPGKELKNVYTLHGVHDAEGIKAFLQGEQAKDVVIVGGGLIGVEITEALTHRGCRVTIVEKMPQIFGMLDWDLAKLVMQHMEAHGVKILVDTEVQAFQGEGEVREVLTNKGVLPAEMVIIAVGVKPQVALAKAAGLKIGATGAIKVDERQCTSDPDIYAAGDCVECRDLVSGKNIHMPMGSTANKQGRVAANNICGVQDAFPGVLGSVICKVFDYSVARTGLTEKTARELKYDVVTAYAPGPDRAHFMPTAKPLFLKLVVDKKNRQLLGAQAAGPGDADKRMDVSVLALSNHMTVDQLANMDLCYAPPYSPAMDNIITAANVARNKLDGYLESVSAAEVKAMLEEQKDFVFLDVRSPAEYEEIRLPKAILIPLGALRGRLQELPKDKPVVAFCKISLRGYEAALVLKAAGFKDVKVMDGGIAMWPYEKEQ